MELCVNAPLVREAVQRSVIIANARSARFWRFLSGQALLTLGQREYDSRKTTA